MRQTLEFVRSLKARPGQIRELYRRGEEFFYVSTNESEETAAFHADEAGGVLDWHDVAVDTGPDSREQVLQQLRNGA